MASSYHSHYLQYPSPFSSKKDYLLFQIQNHVKHGNTLAEYLRVFFVYCKELASTGRPLSDRQMVFSLMRGLGSDYGSFVTAVLKPPVPRMGEMLHLLQAYEAEKNPDHSATIISPIPSMVVARHGGSSDRHLQNAPFKSESELGVIKPVECDQEEVLMCQTCGGMFSLTSAMQCLCEDNVLVPDATRVYQMGHGVQEEGSIISGYMSSAADMVVHRHDNHYNNIGVSDYCNQPINVAAESQFALDLGLDADASEHPNDMVFRLNRIQ